MLFLHVVLTLSSSRTQHSQIARLRIAALRHSPSLLLPCDPYYDHVHPTERPPTDSLLVRNIDQRHIVTATPPPCSLQLDVPLISAVPTIRNFFFFDLKRTSISIIPSKRDRCIDVFYTKTIKWVWCPLIRTYGLSCSDEQQPFLILWLMKTPRRLYKA